MTVNTPRYLYVYDTNRRAYDERQKLVHLNCWYKVNIVGATTRSWILAHPIRLVGRDVTKVPKDRTLWSAYLAWDFSEVLDIEWRRTHRIVIAQAVSCADMATLKKVADLLGYDEHSKTTNEALAVREPPF